MNRRNFIARIVALPFVGSAIGRLFGIKPKIEIRVFGHGEECSYRQLAMLRDFHTVGLERSEGDQMEAAKKRLRESADANGFLYDPSLIKPDQERLEQPKRMRYRPFGE